MTNDFDIPEFQPHPECEKDWEEAVGFLRGLRGAEESGLETEYVAYVIKALRRGETMAEAIWYAQCEWDL